MEKMMREILARADSALKCSGGWDPMELRKSLAVIKFIAHSEIQKEERNARSRAEGQMPRQGAGSQP